METINQNRNSDAGYSLAEVMCALVILGVLFSYALPIYFFSRMKIESSQRRAGAQIVTQKVITNIETRKISDLPIGGTPVAIADPDLLTSAGRTYTARVQYCPIPPIELTSGCENTRPNYRQATIKISHNGNLISSTQVAFADNK